MRRGSIVRIVAVGVGMGALAGAIAVFVPWLPTSAGEEMDRITFVFWFATVIAIAIFALVAALIVYSVLKFRVGPDDESDGPPIHGHTQLEIVWTAIPALLVTAIAIVSAVALSRNADAGPSPLRVDVTAQQFAFRFAYPEQGNLQSGELVLPLGRKVKLTLRSLDVIHGFWVPQFGQKVDAVPGIETTLVITPTRTGTFPLLCTELCGLGHSTMRSRARVVPAAEFAAWVRQQRQGAAAAGGAGAGKALFAAQGCGGCHAFKAAGTSAQVGPALDNLRAAAARAGKPLEAYVRESIVSPDAYVVPGYQPGVMPATFSKTLTAKQLDALVQYLVQPG